MVASNGGSVQAGTYVLSDDGTTLSVDDPFSPDLDILRLDNDRFHFGATVFGMDIVVRYDHSSEAPNEMATTDGRPTDRGVLFRTAAGGVAAE